MNRHKTGTECARQLSSYLGMSAEFLSKIKKRLLQKKRKLVNSPVQG